MKKFSKKIYYALACAALLALLVVPALAATNLTTVDSAGDVGVFISLALNSSGFPVISYYDATNDDLKVVVCGNAACTAGNTLTIVDSAGDVGEYTSLALNSSGFPVISYFNENFDLKVAVCGNTTCTAGNTLTTLDSTGDVGRDKSLALNSSGFPVISYFDLTNGDLKVAVCGNATCTAGNTLTTLDSTGDVGRETSLALNSSGFPVISYYDRTNGDLKVAVCGNATCTTSILTIVDGIGDVGGYTSLALNSSGFPVISYYDVTNGDLKVAVCGNATCSAGNTLTTLDSTGEVGRDTSLALNSSGFPVISYFDGTNGDLKVAVCGNADCSAGNTLTTVDSTGDVGNFSSLALNSSGFPVISYFDNTNLDLKVATGTPPTVAATTLTASYTTGPSSFTVTFSENVYNFAGDIDPDDVSNPANYLLVEDGANNIFNTVSCVGGLAGDDMPANVASVMYLPNTAVVNLGSALPAGNYRLFVCGGTSIINPLQIPLNGGTDFTFDFVVGTATPATTTSITASALPATGFAPHRITQLPKQPAHKAYTSTDMVVEIPSLDISMTIVGVPQTEEGWDVSWLGNNAGYLAGSAFPTWAGNTVLTGHVFDAYGQAGPFAKLKSLKYGDQVFIHAWGLTYTYEVRENRPVFPNRVNAAFKHEELHWVTLVTCEFYNPIQDNYLFRRMVRAVLVEVK